MVKARCKSWMTLNKIDTLAHNFFANGNPQNGFFHHIKKNPPMLGDLGSNGNYPWET